MIKNEMYHLSRSSSFSRDRKLPLCCFTFALLDYYRHPGHYYQIHRILCPSFIYTDIQFYCASCAVHFLQRICLVLALPRAHDVLATLASPRPPRFLHLLSILSLRYLLSSVSCAKQSVALILISFKSVSFISGHCISNDPHSVTAMVRGWQFTSLRYRDVCRLGHTCANQCNY